jgi:catechol 2,3-dioxygenase-like lactoylglutathione lyase family enzyme
VELGQGVSNPMDARNRAVILPIPGTASAGSSQMAIEAIEIKNIASRSFEPLMSDPGASSIKLFVRDLDAMLSVLKNELVPVVTVGGEPVVLKDYPGIDGEIRAVYVRDPDGYPVALMEPASAPGGGGPDQGNILGARIAMVVDDLETTCRWFQDLVGPDLKFWLSPGYIGGNAYVAWTGEREPFRMAQALCPGSPVVLEFIEYRNHNRNFVRPYIQNPGTAHILFMSRDVDIVMPRLKAAGVHTLSSSDAPVFIGPTTRAFFVPDPDGFWAEFMDNGVKRKQE